MWVDEWRYRDCPWCSAHDVEMVIYQKEWPALTAKGGQRFWTTLYCRRCGGPVMIEHGL